MSCKGGKKKLKTCHFTSYVKTWFDHKTSGVPHDKQHRKTNLSSVRFSTRTVVLSVLLSVNRKQHTHIRDTADVLRRRTRSERRSTSKQLHFPPVFRKAAPPGLRYANRISTPAQGLAEMYCADQSWHRKRKTVRPNTSA